MIGLRAICGVLFAYHLGIGLVSVLDADTTAQFATWFYGTSIRVDAQFIYVLKALGMYALFTAAVLATIIAAPKRFAPLAYCVAGLQLARACTRLVFFDILNAGLGVDWNHNLFNAVLLIIEAVLLITFARRVQTIHSD
ncbi:MAG: hypothetical protein ACI9OJ_003357 [Myxococcota bacterium]|jgi:hypothetical protein